MCPRVAGKIKRETEQSVLIGIFKVLASGNVRWGAAKFDDTQLQELEIFLCLALIVVSPEGSRRVVQILWLLE